jgi:tRNA (pseudouridine54-N1)-methyltransferase
MSLIFFLYSATVDISSYSIKDVPGSSGRLDVITRCILAALMDSNENCFDKGIQVWIFLKEYGTFILDSELLSYETFPKNELKLSDYFVDWIRSYNYKNGLEDNPLRSGKIIEKGIIKSIKEFLKLNYKIYILHEQGENFFKYLDTIIREDKIVFIIGNQIGDIMKLEELKLLNIPRLSLGNRSYLASSVIRLIKLNLLSVI